MYQKQRYATGYRPRYGRGASLAGSGASLAGGRRYHRAPHMRGAGVLSWAKRAFNFASKHRGAAMDFAKRHQLASRAMHMGAKQLSKAGPYRGYAHRAANFAASKGYGRRTYRRKRRAPMRGAGVFDDILNGIGKVASIAAPFAPLLL